MKKNIKISIITINLNNASGLEQTLKAIFFQKNVSFQEIETIIIDGNSSDNSKSILSTYSDNIDIYLSEKDEGIYDAMNKGIRLAKGDYIWFINSGDYFYGQNSLAVFLDAIDKNPKADLIFSDIYLYDNDKLVLKKQPEVLTFAYLYSKVLNHQSYILRRSYFDIEQNFSTIFRIVSDWVFLFEIMKKNQISFHKINLPLVVYDNTGVSNTSGNLLKEEQFAYLQSNYSAWEMDSLKNLTRLASKNYYDYLIKSLDSPKRTAIISLFMKCLFLR
jgi:glycosyltransferase involved in cell wall biosynthesis